MKKRKASYTNIPTITKEEWDAYWNDEMKKLKDSPVDLLSKAHADYFYLEKEQVKRAT